jgi:hypothetical protein
MMMGTAVGAPPIFFPLCVPVCPAQTVLCARLRQLLETPACVAADNCVLAILQNTNPVSLSDPGKAIIAGA